MVTPDVALYGGLPLELFPPESRGLAVACATVLGRASFLGSELHVPTVFYSEVTALVSRVISQGLIELEAGKAALDSILSTTWEFHFLVVADVLEFHRALEYPYTSDAEYLAVAAELGCAIITSDARLIALAQTQNLGVEILFVTDHPWAQPGAVEDNPPED